MGVVQPTVGALVNTIRCFTCQREQTVIGPSAFPTFEYPGWEVDPLQFYVPGGRHFCPLHLRKVWVAYCLSPDVPGLCTGERLVDAPRAMADTMVVDALLFAGVRCPDGHILCGVDDTLPDHYHCLQQDVEHVL